MYSRKRRRNLSSFGSPASSAAWRKISTKRSRCASVIARFAWWRSNAACPPNSRVYESGPPNTSPSQAARCSTCPGRPWVPNTGIRSGSLRQRRYCASARRRRASAPPRCSKMVGSLIMPPELAENVVCRQVPGSRSLISCQLGEPNQGAAGVVQHCNGRCCHVGRWHRELGAAGLDPLVVAFDVNGVEHRRGLALLEGRLLIGFGGGTLVQCQLQEAWL